MKRCDSVHSTFVIKTQTALFPMKILHSVMEARHGKQKAGHWVVMRAAVAEVDLRAIACAWSQKGFS